MLLSESSLYLKNIFNLLDNSTYLNIGENIFSSTIPVLENRRLNTWIVDYNHINEFRETYNYSFDEAIEILKEENEIDNLAISIPEEYILEDNTIIDEIDNFVVNPCHDELYNFLNEMVLLEDEANDINDLTSLLQRALNNINIIFEDTICRFNERLEKGFKTQRSRLLIKETIDPMICYFDILNEEYAILNEGVGKRIYEEKRDAIKNMDQKKTNINTKRKEIEDKISKYKESDNSYKKKMLDSQKYKPKLKYYDDPSNYETNGNLSKIITRLRSLYYNYLRKAKSEVYSGKAGFFKRMAVKILDKIDTLMKRKLKRKQNPYEKSN